MAAAGLLTEGLTSSEYPWAPKEESCTVGDLSLRPEWGSSTALHEGGQLGSVSVLLGF